jgi:hypothetical protein
MQLTIFSASAGVATVEKDPSLVETQNNARVGVRES